MSQTHAQQVIIQERIRKDTTYEVSDFEYVDSHEDYYDCDYGMVLPAVKDEKKTVRDIIKEVLSKLCKPQNTK